MSNGKVWRAERHIKETLRRLDYIQCKQVLKALTIWHDVKPQRVTPVVSKLNVKERIRFKYWLYWKYGPECGYCHKVYDWRLALTIDHLQPLSKGGAVRDIRNMVLACRACNEAKGNDWLY